MKGNATTQKSGEGSPKLPKTQTGQPVKGNNFQPKQSEKCK